MFTLRCDYRENRGGCIINTLRSLRAAGSIVPADKYSLVDEVMTTGDYAIQANGHVILVERKTWEDLAASIKDKRIFRNHEKMLAARDLGMRIVYLIEGRMPKPSTMDTRIQGIPMGNLVAKLDHFAMRDGVWVIHTANATETAERLLLLGKNLLTLVPSPARQSEQAPVEMATSSTSVQAPVEMGAPSDEYKSETVGGDGATSEHKSAEPIPNDAQASTTMREVANPDEIIKKKYVQTTTQVRLDMLACIPGVAEVTAKKLSAAHAFSDIISAAPAVLASVNHVQRTQLTALAANAQPVIYRAMLCCIKGVSPAIASLVSAAVQVSDFKRRTTTLTARIAEIRNSSGRRLGNALADRIVEAWTDEQVPVVVQAPIAATSITVEVASEARPELAPISTKIQEAATAP